jgi:hypothetical protein
MSGEVIAGKRTLIERDGREFELPYRHEIEVSGGEEQGRLVSLRALLQGSTFQLAELEVRDDSVIVHLGEEKGRHGPPGVNEIIGYPFPE